MIFLRSQLKQTYNYYSSKLLKNSENQKGKKSLRRITGILSLPL